MKSHSTLHSPCKNNNGSVVTGLQKGNVQAERNDVLKLPVKSITAAGPLLRRLRPHRSPCAGQRGGAGFSGLLFPPGVYAYEHKVEPPELGGIAEMQSRTQHRWGLVRR